ncbi:unnamed protein product [Gongylonema pulchrum]|uniref:Secreted protein n=1 Tax=Gongylonema pulchrum TaxID=637853 RepID=A0A183D2Q6_9BILA|nr:unnamed protein product [Gongylonema pulchrum]
MLKILALAVAANFVNAGPVFSPTTGKFSIIPNDTDNTNSAENNSAATEEPILYQCLTHEHIAPLILTFLDENDLQTVTR